ncbi:MAG: UDP-N-acetylglucosamine--N-acetylmuramyl-(pentapeptide) pyrophosphoryl-undecaprenol N-acetylglucosamine transferase [Candidatus Paceibacterota bacterium]
MKILLTGGGTGGHFYPLIAVAQEINNIVFAKKLVRAKLYFMSDRPYDRDLLLANDIIFVSAPSGKLRRYFAWQNLIDPFKLIAGIIIATWKMFWLYPDVVFSKGGYASLPALWAARLLRIPVFIHESDSRPGRTNRWSAKFAKRIAVSYPEAAGYFPEEKTAVTGNPLREGILHPVKKGAHKFLELPEDRPVILVLGGSLGAGKINETILEILPRLLNNYSVIHQTGPKHFNEIKNRSQVILADNENRAYYKPFDQLDDLALRMAAGAAGLIITRAGSVIFEIAYWQVPAIIIPIPETVSHDQRSNAFTYARSGGAWVIEENNLSASVLWSEIERFFATPTLAKEMVEGAKTFARPTAGRLIAEEIVNIALSHED